MSFTSSPVKAIRFESPPASQVSSEPKSKKKKRKRDTEDESEGELSAGDMTVAITNSDLVLDWPKEDIIQLIDRIGKALPTNDRMKYRTRVQKLDWEKIAFNIYPAEVCRDKWLEIMSKLRTFRTLTELVADSRDWVTMPWTAFQKKATAHPDRPKRPLTPYFRFYHEKIAEYSDRYKGESVAALARKISEEFNALSAKKVGKYRKAYENDRILYKERMKEFKDTHPEAIQKKPSAIAATRPQPPKTPLQHFIDAKFDGQNTQSARDKYSALKEKKKIRWIRKAVADEVRYLTEIKVYQKNHPGYKAKMKRILTKEERELAQKSFGKPEQPPSNGYLLFAKNMSKDEPDLLDKSRAEKNSWIGEQWRNTSDEDKKKFQDEAARLKEEYENRLSEYMASLSELEKWILEPNDRIAK